MLVSPAGIIVVPLSTPYIGFTVFLCSINKLTTLEGAPIKVGGDFNCYSNQLTSLEGAPKEVGGNIGYGAFSPEFLDFLDNLRKQ